VILADCGRARWKIENENNNTLKNQGYHLTHNFGHGEQHAGEIYCILLLLAFLPVNLFRETRIGGYLYSKGRYGVLQKNKRKD